MRIILILVGILSVNFAHAKPLRIICDFFVDETKLYFDGRVIDLDQITVGHFDIENENVIYWGRL